MSEKINTIDGIISMLAPPAGSNDSVHTSSRELLCSEIPGIEIEHLDDNSKNISREKLHTFPVSVTSTKLSRKFINKQLFMKNWDNYYEWETSPERMERYHAIRQKVDLDLSFDPINGLPKHMYSDSEVLDQLSVCLNTHDILPDVIGQSDNFIEVEYFSAGTEWRYCTPADITSPGFLKVYKDYMNTATDLDLYVNLDTGNPGHIMYNEKTKAFRAIGLTDLELSATAFPPILPVDWWYFVPDIKWSEPSWNDLTSVDVGLIITEYYGELDSVLYKPTSKQVDAFLHSTSSGI